jgi:putative endonuclease
VYQLKQPAVYILSNHTNTTLYVGVSSDLIRRIWLHKQKQVEGFSRKYNLTKLVYYEMHERMNMAILREKQIKKWRREKKDRLIELFNPEWNDLYDELV